MLARSGRVSGAILEESVFIEVYIKRAMVAERPGVKA
jgi:hypothetical protein